MTSGGNIKRTVSFYVSAGGFLAAIVFAALITTGPAFRPLMVLAIVVGIIGAGGVWATGLGKSSDPDGPEWHEATR